MLCQRLLLVAALGLLLHCDGQQEDSGSESDGAVRATCPSFGTRVRKVPSGACDGNMSCALEVQATCEDGVQFIPVTPSTVNCRCTNGSWNCSTIRAGLGLLPCADAGAR
jgi:hypothetical protein